MGLKDVLSGNRLCRFLNPIRFMIAYWQAYKKRMSCMVFPMTFTEKQPSSKKRAEIWWKNIAEGRNGR